VRDYSRLEATAFSRDRIRSLCAIVAGAGALGNEVIKNLALIGVGRLLVVDRDRIEASNLTRSVLFCVPDIGDHIAAGTPKAALAARRAMELNPDVDASSHVGEVGDLGSGVLRQADVIFSCLDNEMARLELGWACNRLDKPLVDGGLGLINPASGMVSLFPGALGPCYACRKGAERRRELIQELQGREDPCGVKERLQRQADVVPTTPTMASIVGAFQVEAAVRHLFRARHEESSTVGVSHRITLHPRVQLDALQFERSPTCPLHQSESLIRDVRERSDRCSHDWTAAQVLKETAASGGFLSFDWPMTARAACHACGHTWEPLMRRARFRRERCPACAAADIAETEVLTGIDSASAWADRSLAALGLPPGHIHEVVIGSTADAPRCHVEVTGDLRHVREASTP
jgi:molybdopterin/thiamine biosynthesis adenylyltransferase